MGGAEKAEIEKGNHSQSNKVEQAVQSAINFVKRQGPYGWDDPWTKYGTITLLSAFLLISVSEIWGMIQV